MSASPLEVVVIGAGVIGLTTALKIQEASRSRVTIVADVLPTDPRSIRYTSHHAGAIIMIDHEWQNIERETFEAMWKLSGDQEASAQGCFLRLNQTEYACGNYPLPEALKGMPDFRYLANEALSLHHATSAVSFTALTVDPQAYLKYLFSRFTGNGGSVVRGFVQHINQVIAGDSHVFPGSTSIFPPDVLVVCAGIGARSLGGVDDQDVFPIRGQSVVLKAPWVEFGCAVNAFDSRTYVFPRSNGYVMIGGIYGEHDWYPMPRADTTAELLIRGLALCPELAPPEIRAMRTPTVSDLWPLVVEEGCGLRPARAGGIRLEREWVQNGTSERKVLVIHNYGHAGCGFQGSWGSASRVLEFLEDSLLAVPTV